MFDLISIGDSTIDNFVKIHDAEVKCNLNKTDCQLCVEYGDKIPVDKLTHLVAGNAANNAVGSARLKLETAIYTNVGSDPQGQQILEKLKNEGINTRYVVINEGMESNLSTVLIFQGERTIFVYHQQWKYLLPDLDPSKWVYFTSVGSSFTESSLLQELDVYLERTGAKLFYNPGTYQLMAGVKKNPKLLTLTELFIVNKEEAEKILSKEELPIKKLLKGLADLGPKMIVVTDGIDGSYGFDGKTFFHIDIFPAHLVEMTGAGDGYATGLLAGLFHGESLAGAMRWGAANGASVVEQIGSQAGLLTYEQMQDKLKENSKIIAKEI
ncbi:MAG: carbohydrate kinase family protein [Candidatus Daviesbacteria bacterium]|nr:carbohydrate kinase family protein [Candidatus Daviesbacteria bacterium]